MTLQHWTLSKFKKLSGIVLVLLVGLSGCQSLGFLAPKEPVTIRFAYSVGDDAYYQRLIEAFNKEYSYITVEAVSFQELFRGRRGDEEAGELNLDVFAASQGELSYLLEDDFTVSLNAMMAEDTDFDLSDFYPSAIEALSLDGQRWGVPFAVDMLLMHYNKDLFDRRNVPYPQSGWTWDDFLNRAVSLSDPSAGEFGYAYYLSGNMGVLEPMVFVQQRGGQFFDDLQQPTRPTFDQSANVAPMQWYADLIQKHHVAPQPGERTVPYPGSGIESGKYAMWMGYYSDHWDVNEGRMTLPKGEAPGTLGYVMGLFISTSTTSPDACWKWITFVSKQTPPGMIPARRSVMESDAYKQEVGEDVVAALRAGIEDLVAFNFDMDQQLERNWNQAINALIAAVSKIQKGEDVQSTLDEAQQKSGF